MSSQCKKHKDVYAYFLCELKTPKSFWKPFFDLLPKSFSESHPFFWSTSELTNIYGTTALATLMRTKQQLKRNWTENEYSFGLDDYYYSYIIFQSLAIDGQFLLPLVSHMGHRRYSQLLPNSLPSLKSLIKTSTPFNFLAQQDFIRGDEISAYHDKSLSGSLFIQTGGVYRLHYTFMLEPQASDGFQIYLTLDSFTPKDDPLYATKEEALRWFGWEDSVKEFESDEPHNGEEFTILVSRIDEDLRQWLRIAVVKDQAEWDRYRLSEKYPKDQLSESNEREVFLALARLCITKLNQFPSTLVEDVDIHAELFSQDHKDEEAELDELLKKDVTTEEELQKLMRLLSKKHKREEPKDPEQQRREKQVGGRAIMYRMSEKRALLGTLSMAVQKLETLSVDPEFLEQVQTFFVGLRDPYIQLMNI